MPRLDALERSTRGEHRLIVEAPPDNLHPYGPAGTELTG